MPPGGATFDESTVPPWKRGLQGGFGKGKPTPAVAAGHGIPSSTEEGSLSSMDLVKGRRHEDGIKEW